ncbi:RHS repeat domain-containing protein [Bacteroides congonensis]
MKRIKLYTLFLLCWLSSVASGQISPQNFQRLLPGNTSLTVAVDSRNSSKEYDGSNNILAYFFGLDCYMDISVTLSNAESDSVNISLLDDKGELIASSQNSKLDVMILPPGMYCLAAEGIRENGVISMNIETKPSEKVVIDLGRYSELFQISCDEKDTRELYDGYRPADWPWENSPNDVFYRFTLDTPMFLWAEMTTNLEEVTGVLYCLEEEPGTGQLTPIPLVEDFIFTTPIQGRYLKTGTYYLVAEGPVDNGGIAIDCMMKTEIVGLPGRYTVPLGLLSTNIQQTLTGDSHRTSSEHGDSVRNDVYYSFDLRCPMKLSVSLNRSSNLGNVNLYLLDGSNKVIVSSTDGSLFVEKLLWGKYYLMVEGQERDGMFAVDFELEPQERSIDLGKVSGTKTFSETYNTTNAENRFGLSPNEIFYKLQLTRGMDISISNHPSTNNIILSNATVIYLLDADENVIQSTQDGKAGLTVKNLPAGTYYIVSEGKVRNMNIVTQISTTYYDLHPDKDPDKDSDKGQDMDKDMGKHNYIMTRTYTKTDGSDSRINIDYFDGLGRSSNSILLGASPSGKDIATRQDYDSFGRRSCEWLPRVSTSSNGRYLTPTEFEGLSSGIYNNDTHPYSMPVYESSPLNRILEQYGPGQDWYSKGASVSTAYKTNLLGDAVLNCKLYVVGGTRQNPTLGQSGNYATGQLYVTGVKDEDGNTTYEFKDKLGQIVLTRQMKDNVAHDTYYVYDDFGNKCFVLPPRIQDEDITQAKLDELAYQYIYDARNRQIARKLPSAGWTYYVYDKADRLIFSQDSIQRKKGEWLFTIPDVFGRVVLTGICSDTISVTNKFVKGVYSSVGQYNSYFIHIDGVYGFFSASPTILSANYYDNYDFRGVTATKIPSAGTEYNEEIGYGTRYTGVKGLLTGTLTAQMNADGTPSSAYLYSVMYYDTRGRVIQTKSNNPLADGVDQEYLAYDFVGNVIQRKHVHQVAGKAPQTEIYKYDYDHAGRLLTTTHKVNTEAEMTLVNNVYDELGRLATDKRNGNAKFKTDYKYNVRNWTKSITSPLFSQTLYYNDKRENGTLNTPTYNGNISGMDWTGGKGYNFTYDHLSRLTNAAYLENNVGSTKFNTSYSYDKHGNMLTLSRNGNQATAIDNLTFTYRGNQLMRADDTGTNSTMAGSMDFRNGTNTGDDYAYDANGNLIKDSNKNIVDIQYNVLNLPSKITFGDGNSVSYMYAADGRKLQTVHTINGATTTTDYAGNMIYENGTLKRILVDGGYNENGEYYFYLKDHLGNNRVVSKQDGTVVETNDYYPYGMTFAESAATDAQPYKYNGKELDTKGGLNLYDYGARHYDPVLGRFMTVDPLAEKYYSWSPYAYCLNNPMKYIDPDGRDPKKLSHWIRFGKETAKAVSVVASVGLQVAGEVELGSKKLGGDMNLISQDVAGVKDGVFFHPGGNFDKAETKQGVELGAGLVGVSVQKKIKEESGNQILEEQQSISLGLLEHTNTETTPIDQNYRTVGKTQKTSETKTADLSVKAKAIIGIEFSLDLNKLWDALGNLLLGK